MELAIVGERLEDHAGRHRLPSGLPRRAACSRLFLHAAADVASASQHAVGVAGVRVPPGGGAFDGTEPVETFSSDGPRRIFYEADGTAITAGDFSSTGGRLLNKPDVAAADGVSTSTPGFSRFFGTSAAQPHAAAIGGLMVDAAALYPSPATAARSSIRYAALIAVVSAVTTGSV